MGRAIECVIITPIHPGEPLGDELEFRGVSLAEFSRITGVPLAEVEKYVNKEKDFTPSFAKAIEKVLPELAAEYWMRWQSSFNESRAHYGVRKVRQDLAYREVEVIDRYVNTERVFNLLDEYIEHDGLCGRLPAFNKAAQYVGFERACDIAGIADSAAIYGVSQKSKVNMRNLRAWMFCAMYLGAKRAEDVIVQYSQKQGQAFFHWLADQSINGRGLSTDTLAAEAAKHGIAYHVLPHFRLAPVDAYSFWQNNHPIIVATNRRKKERELAIDMLQHVGHILLHTPRPWVSGDVTYAEADAISIKEATLFAERALDSHSTPHSVRIDTKRRMPRSAIGTVREDAAGYHEHGQGAERE